MTEAQTKLSIPWPRVMAEGLVIVVSILLAFAIEAWWQQQNERKAEREVLVSLQQDFRENREILLSARTAHERIKISAGELMEYTGPAGARSNDADSISVLIQGVLNRYRFAPVEGGLAALMASGDWDLIRSTELRSELAGWPGRVASLNRREDQAVEGINNRLLVRIWELAPIRTIDMALEQFAEVGPSRFPLNYDALLSDMYFEGAIDERWQDAHNALRMLDRLDGSANRILELINRELEG